MIKAYFKSDTNYGAPDLNEIVKSLRTDGIYSEEATNLKVTKSTGVNVNIADGVGWVDGVRLEVSAGETLTLPTQTGNYSIIMKLTSAENVVSNFTLAVESGQIVGNHVLAWVAVSASNITTVTDKRVVSVFKGQTNFPYNIYNGTQTFEQTMNQSQSLAKTINITAGCKKVKCYIGSSVIAEIGTEGINAIYGDSTRYDSSGTFSFYPLNSFKVRKGALYTDGRVGSNVGTWFGLGVCGADEINITGITFVSNVLTFNFKNQNTSASANLNCTITWEAW